jgi:Protein of unknown function (DUF3025)
VRPLVRVRLAAPFEPGFLERDVLFWPLRRAVSSLDLQGEFPSAEQLGRVFEGAPPVRFVAPGARRRRGEPVDLRDLYDARITIERKVPTRPACWHDFMNALVWGTFPNAKRALHARQHRAIAARVLPGARQLPPRSPELDALALLDEGGIVVLADDTAAVQESLRTGAADALRSFVRSGRADAVVFGHAIYESLALGVRPAVVAALVLARTHGEADVVRAVDRTLARAFDDHALLGSTRDLRRVDVREAEPCP